MSDRSIDQILAGPDYFTCERLTARLPKSVCIQRQTKRVVIGPTHWYLCFDCAQGAEIAKSQDKVVPQQKPPVICAAEGCDKPAGTRKLCGTCYGRWQHGRLPEMGPFVRIRKQTGQRAEV